MYVECKKCGTLNNNNCPANCWFCGASLNDYPEATTTLTTYNYSYTNSLSVHDFNYAKNQIRIFAQNAQAPIQFDQFQTSGGLFGWFDHKVTGEEMNAHVGKLQDYLISLNDQNKKIINQFGEVYNALESLDRDYIRGILASVALCQENNDKIKVAQKNIDDAMLVLQATIGRLTEFQKEIESIENTYYIDSIWSQVQNHDKSISDSLDRIKLNEENIDSIKADNEKNTNEYKLSFERFSNDQIRVNEQLTQQAEEINKLKKADSKKYRPFLYISAGSLILSVINLIICLSGVIK